MKKIILSLISFLLLNYCCGVTDHSPKIEGVYEGTYLLTQNIGTDSVYNKQCSINIEFTDNTYNYEGDDFSLLPGGGGIYSIDSETITVTDTVGHQNDIDPNFLLNGKISYTKRGDDLTLNQNNTNHKLKRQINLIKKD